MLDLVCTWESEQVSLIQDCIRDRYSISFKDIRNCGEISYVVRHLARVFNTY